MRDVEVLLIHDDVRLRKRLADELFIRSAWI